MALSRATCSGVDFLLSLKKLNGSRGNWVILLLLAVAVLALTSVSGGAMVGTTGTVGVEVGVGVGVVEAEGATGAVVMKVLRAKAINKWSSGVLRGKGMLPSQSRKAFPSRGVTPSLVYSR